MRSQSARVFAFVVLTSGIVIAPSAALSQQLVLPANGTDGFTMPNLPQVDLPSSLNSLQAVGFQPVSVDPLKGTPAALAAGQGKVEPIFFQKSTESSQNSKPTSTIVWSDNRGTWKSNSLGNSCMLQSTSGMNADFCN